MKINVQYKDQPYLVAVDVQDCSHLNIHKEEVTGEFWEREGVAEYTGYTWICNKCDEVVENVTEDGCNE